MLVLSEVVRVIIFENRINLPVVDLCLGCSVIIISILICFCIFVINVCLRKSYKF